MSRSFRFGIDGSELVGRYMADTPMEAARKAFSIFCRGQYKGLACRRRFLMQEMTRGSDKKVFEYVGSRKLLDHPYQVMRDGKLVTIRYKTKIRSRPL